MQILEIGIGFKSIRTLEDGIEILWFPKSDVNAMFGCGNIHLPRYSPEKRVWSAFDIPQDILQTFHANKFAHGRQPPRNSMLYISETGVWELVRRCMRNPPRHASPLTRWFLQELQIGLQLRNSEEKNKPEFQKENVL